MLLESVTIPLTFVADVHVSHLFGSFGESKSKMD